MKTRSPISAFRRCFRLPINGSRDSGQSLIETALALPFLLLIALNAINFAYYFFVAINLAAAPRNAVEYSVQGFATPSQLSIPTAGSACGPASSGDTSYSLSVSTLAYNDMTRVLPYNGGGNPCPNIGEVQVCNSANGEAGTGTALTTTCKQYGGSTTYTPDADPEAPNFLLDRVDVIYTVTPLIGGNIFGIKVLPTPTFHRQVSMREMN
jgi:hypothetical protein